MQFWRDAAAAPNPVCLSEGLSSPRASRAPSGSIGVRRSPRLEREHNTSKVHPILLGQNHDLPDLAELDALFFKI